MIETEVAVSVGKLMEKIITKFFSETEYESILRVFDLAESQILSQNLSELKNSLLRIEDTIANNQKNFQKYFFLKEKDLF